MFDRDRNLQDIGNLYGLPGEYDTDEGHRFLIETIAALGAAALTDDAIAMLAAKHRAHDDRIANAA